MPKLSTDPSLPEVRASAPSLVEVTVIAKGLVRLDVYEGEHRASAVLTHEEAKKIAVALARA